MAEPILTEERVKQWALETIDRIIAGVVGQDVQLPTQLEITVDMKLQTFSVEFPWSWTYYEHKDTSGKPTGRVTDHLDFM